jgi:hypothetical protein
MKAAATIRYVSGREEQFEVDFWGGHGIEGRLQEFLKCPNVVLQTTGELIIIPATAIESLSITLPEDEEAKPALKSVRVAKRLK